MMKKSWKNRSAVSPVIATILMVAITVVLAAVLYVMVMGFGGNSGSTATGALRADKTSAGHYTIVLTSISKADVLLSDTRLVITPVPTGYTAAAMNATLAGQTHCTAGDNINIVLTAGTTYNVNLLFVPTGNNIATLSIVAS